MPTGYEGTRRRYDTGIFEERRLSNGIRVWLQKSPIIVDDGGILTVFLPGIGSQLDPVGQFGLAHFFEHIPFRGTLNKPSHDLLVHPVTDRGGDLHVASTSHDFTMYSVTDLTAEYFDLALETLYEITINPRCAQEDVTIEAGTITNERRMVFADGNKVRTDLFFRAPYGREHPLGHLPIGDEAAIAGMTAESLKAFHTKHYHSGNIQIICGCAFPEIADVVERIDRIFGKLPPAPPTTITTDRYRFATTPRTVEVVEPKSGRDYMFFRFPVPNNPAKPDHALSSLAAILAEDLDAPLVKELRLKRGLVYEANLCWTTNLQNYLEFAARFPVTAEHFATAEEIFYQTLRDLDEETVVRKFMQWQMKRRVQFKHPEVACRNAVSEIVGWGRPYSFGEKDTFQDDVAVAEIFWWRDYLLENKPYIIKIKSTE